MSALAAQHGAINLSQGFPDFDMDERLIELVHQAMQKGFNQYAPMAGLSLLRYAIADDFLKRYELDIDSELEITITPGATYAIYTALACILQAGDEVIVLEPAYDSYIPNIVQCGAMPVCVPLKAPDFRPDWDEIRGAVSPNTRAIIINAPHNPTGSIFEPEDLEELAKIAERYQLYVVSDEVYEQLVFDGRRHQSVLAHPGLRSRSYAVFSFGKSFHCTGWKIGYCIAPAALSNKFRNLHQFLGFSVSTPMQKGLADYLTLPQREVPGIQMQARRDLFLRQMKKTPFRLLRPAAGSYFQILSYEGISPMDDHSFATWLTKTYGVATIPVSAFYSDGRDDHLLRFCFAKKNETLEAAAARLSSIVM
ncbi:MAG: aminotransferase class I/II-fold pyridoxal phosphate-dependent enzyme [Bacteroidetes bacterium]|nr:aminotransferase class I/II-fold pyridoxal phosphate-dependent enzyme [Bacteroidota bacterium]